MLVTAMAEGSGPRIAQLREAAGWTQAELGRRIGVSRSAVAQWEHQSNEPKTSHLRDLAKLFAVSFDWLASGAAEGAMDNEGRKVDPANIPEQAKLLVALLGPGKELWQLDTDKIAGAGRRRGYYVIVDTNKTAVAGDFVAVDYSGNIIFRLYYPPHLFTVAYGSQDPLLTVDGTRIKIYGVLSGTYSL